MTGWLQLLRLGTEVLPRNLSRKNTSLLLVYRFKIKFSIIWRVHFGQLNCVLFGVETKDCIIFLKTVPDNSFPKIYFSFWMAVREAQDKYPAVNLNKARLAKEPWAYGSKSVANGKLGSCKITKRSFFLEVKTGKMGKTWVTIPEKFWRHWYLNSKRINCTLQYVF